MSASSLSRGLSDDAQSYPHAPNPSGAYSADKPAACIKNESSSDAIIAYGDQPLPNAGRASKKKWESIRLVAPADLRAEEATDKKPDGIYAWMVIAACFISLMLSIGINDAYGVYQQHYQLNEFPSETATLVSWIGTVQFLIMCVGGVFSGFL
ncbi:hypothetical protein LPJ56_005580, partial [Coemansia sp. RSA 2599]